MEIMAKMHAVYPLEGFTSSLSRIYARHLHYCLKIRRCQTNNNHHSHGHRRYDIFGKKWGIETDQREKEIQCRRKKPSGIVQLLRSCVLTVWKLSVELMQVTPCHQQLLQGFSAKKVWEGRGQTHHP